MALTDFNFQSYHDALMGKVKEIRVCGPVTEENNQAFRFWPDIILEDSDSQKSIGCSSMYLHFDASGMYGSITMVVGCVGKDGHLKTKKSWFGSTEVVLKRYRFLFSNWNLCDGYVSLTGIERV